MHGRLAQCPSCQLLLEVPPGCSNCYVRCSRCHARFRLPRRIAVTDDAVASWLQEGDKGQGAKLTPAHADANDDFDDIGESVQEEPQGEPLRQPQEVQGETATAVAATVRLVKFNSEGALLDFPASALKDEAFRLTFPRRCMRCGTESHLLPHVVMFTPQHTDSFSLEAEHATEHLALHSETAAKLDGHQLLERLPLVPNVPSPGNLPMPYWVCDLCSASGVISGKIQVDESGNGHCELRISNLQRAAEFLQLVSGSDPVNYQPLLNYLKTIEHVPWDSLPSMVQHRIEQWYKPKYGERYIAYVPDRDHARTEDGMSGLLITTLRMIYHTHIRHRELMRGQMLKLELTTEYGKASVQIFTQAWQVKHFAVDRDGLSVMRGSLTRYGFSPVWA